LKSENELIDIHINHKVINNIKIISIKLRYSCKNMAEREEAINISKT
jgi:hypothetical protein